MMRISEKGITLIKEFEGCSLTAYPDPGTGGDRLDDWLWLDPLC